MRTTYRELLKELEESDGNISDSCIALQQLNQARKILWPLGDWEGTIEYACVYLNGGCFYLPWHIESIKNAWSGGQEITVEKSNWIPINTTTLSLYGARPTTFIPTGVTSPLPFEFPRGRVVGARANDQQDKGKHVTVQAKDSGGSTWSEKIKLSGIKKMDKGELEVLSLQALSKDKTIGAVDIYAVCPQCEDLIHTMQSEETVSSFRQYKVSGCSSPYAIVKAKKKFFKIAENDLDKEFDLISTEAISFVLDAINHKKSQDYEKYNVSLKVAQSHLNVLKEDFRSSSKPGAPASFMPVINSGPGRRRHRFCR